MGDRRGDRSTDGRDSQGLLEEHKVAFFSTSTSQIVQLVLRPLSNLFRIARRWRSTGWWASFGHVWTDPEDLLAVVRGCGFPDAVIRPIVVPAYYTYQSEKVLGRARAGRLISCPTQLQRYAYRLGQLRKSCHLHEGQAGSPRCPAQRSSRTERLSLSVMHGKLQSTYLRTLASDGPLLADQLLESSHTG
jgi:hypothetical protein